MFGSSLLVCAFTPVRLSRQQLGRSRLPGLSALEQQQGEEALADTSNSAAAASNPGVSGGAAVGGAVGRGGFGLAALSTRAQRLRELLMRKEIVNDLTEAEFALTLASQMASAGAAALHPPALGERRGASSIDFESLALKLGRHQASLEERLATSSKASFAGLSPLQLGDLSRRVESTNALLRDAAARRTKAQREAAARAAEAAAQAAEMAAARAAEASAAVKAGDPSSEEAAAAVAEAASGWYAEVSEGAIAAAMADLEAGGALDDLSSSLDDESRSLGLASLRQDSLQSGAGSANTRLSARKPLGGAWADDDTSADGENSTLLSASDLEDGSVHGDATHGHKGAYGGGGFPLTQQPSLAEVSSQEDNSTMKSGPLSPESLAEHDASLTGKSPEGDNKAPGSDYGTPLGTPMGLESSQASPERGYPTAGSDALRRRFHCTVTVEQLPMLCLVTPQELEDDDSVCSSCTSMASWEEDSLDGGEHGDPPRDGGNEVLTESDAGRAAASGGGEGGGEGEGGAGGKLKSITLSVMTADGDDTYPPVVISDRRVLAELEECRGDRQKADHLSKYLRFTDSAEAIFLLPPLGPASWGGSGGGSLEGSFDGGFDGGFDGEACLDDEARRRLEARRNDRLARKLHRLKCGDPRFFAAHTAAADAAGSGDAGSSRGAEPPQRRRLLFKEFKDLKMREASGLVHLALDESSLNSMEGSPLTRNYTPRTFSAVEIQRQVRGMLDREHVVERVSCSRPASPEQGGYASVEGTANSASPLGEGGVSPRTLDSGRLEDMQLRLGGEEASVELFGANGPFRERGAEEPALEAALEPVFEPAFEPFPEGQDGGDQGSVSPLSHWPGDGGDRFEDDGGSHSSASTWQGSSVHLKPGASWLGSEADYQSFGGNTQGSPNPPASASGLAAGSSLAETDDPGATNPGSPSGTTWKGSSVQHHPGGSVPTLGDVADVDTDAGTTLTTPGPHGSSSQATVTFEGSSLAETDDPGATNPGSPSGTTWKGSSVQHHPGGSFPTLRDLTDAGTTLATGTVGEEGTLGTSLVGSSHNPSGGAPPSGSLSSDATWDGSSVHHHPFGGSAASSLPGVSESLLGAISAAETEATESTEGAMVHAGGDGTSTEESLNLSAQD
eukprot:CAMPEP_0172644248 /NCGR_PEP_ID=MMETSP1068-20121228/239112_1 /TAXON_ID=35684 /ORGANISM="Pseudopedinella elastica, Strain CCMP716" /LENGTH=1132 /DNA_ID=CAMNT_0013458439 /DNA_START=161 /DNA_END=3562 /DNA_ORIENTATION=-